MSLLPPGSRRLSLAPTSRRVASPTELYDAATRGDLGQLLRTLPKAIQRRLASSLGGMSLPAKDKHRIRFLSELADLAARLLEPSRAEAVRATALLAQRGYQEGIVRPEVGLLDQTFGLIRDVAACSLRSSKPSDYLRLLSRPGVDIERLVTTMSFFAGDRRVRLRHLDMAQRRSALDMERHARQGSRPALRALLSALVDRLPAAPHDAPPHESDWRILEAFDVAAWMVREPLALVALLEQDHELLIEDKSLFPLREMTDRLARAREDRNVQRYAHLFLISCGLYLARGGALLRFGRMFKEGPIEGYVVLKPERLRSYGYEAVATRHIDDPTVLLASDREHTIQHELQHMFDKIIYVAGAIGAGKDESEEPSPNLLGMEYRARLAELAFTHDDELVEDAMREVRDNVALEADASPEMRVRTRADQLVHDKLRRYRRAAAIRPVSRRLLDQAYRQAYGLTYSQIVEPFSPRGT